jgi:hypothetical protein
MSACDDFINKVTRELPDPCKTKDLVKAGIFKSYASAAMTRRTQKGPSYFKLQGKGIIYPKQSVIEWMNSGKHAN